MQTTTTKQSNQFKINTGQTLHYIFTYTNKKKTRKELDTTSHEHTEAKYKLYYIKIKNKNKSMRISIAHISPFPFIFSFHFHSTLLFCFSFSLITVSSNYYLDRLLCEIANVINYLDFLTYQKLPIRQRLRFVSVFVQLNLNFVLRHDK